MTSKFTLEQLRRAKRLAAWAPGEGRLGLRTFFYTQKWFEAFSEMAGARERGRVRTFWLSGDDESAVGTGGWVDLEDFDISPKGRVAGLVETFVMGTPRERLMRPHGFGSEIVFERMRSSRSPVVEMRTADTRTFGFFAKRDVFVATFLDMADRLHNTAGLHEIYADQTLRIMNGLADGEKDVSSAIDDLVGDVTMSDLSEQSAQWNEIDALLGGVVEDVGADPDEQAVYEALQWVRSLLASAMNDEKVGVNALSRRLGVSPSAASKMVASETDMKISTAVLWARALGRTFHFFVIKTSQCSTCRQV